MAKNWRDYSLKEQQTIIEDLVAKGYQVMAVDSQIVASIALCEKKTELRFLKNLKLIEEDKADYLERGDLMHFLLKVYYTLAKRSDKFTQQQRIEVAIELARRRAVKMDTDVLSSEEYIDVFLQYCQRWKADNWVPVEVEQPFSLILVILHDKKVVVLYEGVIDLVVENYSSDSPYKIVDHKGTKRRYSPLELTFQFLGYCWATKHNTLTAQQIGFQKSLKIEEKFTRYTFSYPQSNIDEWQETTIKYITRWLDAMERGDYLMNIGGIACNAFNRLCPYYKNICRATPDSRDWNISTKFEVIEPWSPWTRDEEVDKILEDMIR